MKRSFIYFSLLLALFAASAIAQTATVGQKETGLAAVYTSRLNHHVTSSGQIYEASRMTAAHKTLPYGSRIRVTNPKNNKSVIVKVNDRGPTQQGRILDLSPAAAAHLGIRHNQMREVNLDVLSVGNGRTTPQHTRGTSSPSSKPTGE
jgi:rare lipoprotein A